MLRGAKGGHESTRLPGASGKVDAIFLNLFSLNSPLMRALNHIADRVILHLLWVLCSIPIFTMGAFGPLLCLHEKNTQKKVILLETSLIPLRRISGSLLLYG